MGEIMELTRNLSMYQCVHETDSHTHTHTHTDTHQHARSFEDGHALRHVPACTQTDAHGHKTEIRMEWIMKLLLTLFTYDPLSITQMDTTLSYWSQPSLSLLRCSCRFSSRYLSAHLHRSADGFRGRWWDNKSEAAPSDYHHGDQLSTHSSTLKTPNVLTGNDTHLLRHAQWVSNGWVSSSSSLPFENRW